MPARKTILELFIARSGSETEVARILEQLIRTGPGDARFGEALEKLLKARDQCVRCQRDVDVELRRKKRRKSAQNSTVELTVAVDSIDAAITEMGAWLTDNTAGVFEEQPAIDTIRGELLDLTIRLRRFIARHSTG